MEKRRITLPSFIKTASVGKERQLQWLISPRSVERYLRLQLERRLLLLHQPQKRNELLQKGRGSQLKWRRRLLQRMQRRSIGMNALLRDARTRFRKEDCAKGMEQRSNYAAVKDVRTKLRKEECASSMEQRSSNAAVKDARTLLKQEECVLGMEQRGKYA
jgi:hypothetical protein